MENRRTLLAIVLVLFLWSGYNLLFPPKPAQQTQAQTDKGAVDKNHPVQEQASVVPAVVPPQTDSVIDSAPERQIRVHSPLFDLVFSNRGGRLINAQLNQYKQENTPDSPPVIFLSDEQKSQGYFSLRGEDGFSIPQNLVYSCSVKEDQIDITSSAKTTVTFQALTPDQLRVSKIFTFYPDKYAFDIDIVVENLTDQLKKGDLIVNISDRVDDTKKAGRYNFIGPATFDGEKLHNDSIKDIEKKSQQYNKILWTSFTSKYFAAIICPLDNTFKSLDVSASNDHIVNSLKTDIITVSPNSSSLLKYTAYIGPRDFDLLKASGHQFERIIDLGFFGIIAKPLLSFLKFFYGIFGNYGVAIIVLTICIKALFWPLTQKSYTSMKQMQKLQPHMQKLRAKYAKDKQKLNQEMMALYKEHRVNPFGGCLPMVIQIPVFFALYRVLLEAIELRHAPFMLWITDLSAADTLISDALGLGFALGPLPLIMGVTMFLQQKMTPTNMDPTQAKVMMFMPVFFTFIFLSFPSGLVVYWLVNNLLTIGQQYMINRKPA